MEPQDPAAKLKEVLAQQEKSAQLLVRRDLELMRANEKLHALDEQKSKFISVAAHQLRTPLSAIRWSLGYLLSGRVGKLPQEQEELARQALESTIRLVRLVNELLGVDRLEGGRVVYTLVPIDMHDAIKSVVSEIAPEAQRRGVSIELDNRIADGSAAYTDAAQLRIVLQNLLENAVKYTRTSGSVTVKLEETDKTISVSFKDTGIGIPTDQQEQIFRQFFRARNAVKVETDGSGLGLSLVRETLQNMGGSVSFTSEENVGSTFTVILPKTAPAA